MTKREIFKHAQKNYTIKGGKVSVNIEKGYAVLILINQDKYTTIALSDSCDEREIDIYLKLYNKPETWKGHPTRVGDEYYKTLNI